MHVVVRVCGGGQEDQVARLKRCDETVSMTLAASMDINRGSSV